MVECNSCPTYLKRNKQGYLSRECKGLKFLDALSSASGNEEIYLGSDDKVLCKDADGVERTVRLRDAGNVARKEAEMFFCTNQRGNWKKCLFYSNK
jgi:hypothetical protein